MFVSCGLRILTARFFFLHKYVSGFHFLSYEVRDLSSILGRVCCSSLREIDCLFGNPKHSNADYLTINHFLMQRVAGSGQYIHIQLCKWEVAIHDNHL